MEKVIGLIILFFAFVSCDKVKNPRIEKKCDFSSIHLVDSNTSVINVRKVLVQDYTGHTCGNCPRAAEDLETIIAANPGKIVGMAVHAGLQFSPPKLPGFPEDFRTTAGSQWDTYFSMSTISLPKGTINWAQTPYSQSRSTWAGHVATQLSSPQKAKLFMKTSVDTVAMAVKVETKVTLLQATNNDVKMVIVLTEDSIIARQKDYTPPVGATVENLDEIPNYVFMHVLRGDINGTWGEVLKTGPVAAGTEISSVNCGNLYPWGNLKKNLKNMSVVAIVYTRDAGSGSIREVLQVEKIHLKK